MRYRQPFTWFNIVGTVAEAQSLLQEFYNTLVALYEEEIETGNIESPFYGWELKKETVSCAIKWRFSASASQWGGVNAALRASLLPAISKSRMPSISCFEKRSQSSKHCTMLTIARLR